MFKCYDNVVGEIVECDDKKSFIEEVNNRFVHYNNTRLSDYSLMKVSCYCIKNVYYLIQVR